MAKEMSFEKGPFSLSLPPANIRINRETLPAGTLLYRIHRSHYAGDEFNQSGKGNARFSPVFTADQLNIPTLYAGENTRVALCEVILHDVDIRQPFIVYPTDQLVFFRHSQLQTTADLRLVSLDLPSLVKMRADKKLIQGDPTMYGLSQRWAEALHHQYQDIQGLRWPSRQHEGNACLLFGDRIAEGTLRLKGKTQKITSPAVLKEFLFLVNRMGIFIDESVD